MEHYDVIVVGSGSGMLIASTAVASGFKTAIVEHGPMGGTCLNRGCVPSKIIIHPADITVMIREGERLGVKAQINSINFSNIMARMSKVVSEDSGSQARAIEATPGLTWFKETAEFISDYTLQLSKQIIKGERIFIVSGARPGIPPVRGIEDVNYLTSDTVLELDTLPKSIIIMGGGYIGAEYGHFFSGLGTRTTIIQRPDRMVPEEDPEISEQIGRASCRERVYSNV